MKLAFGRIEDLQQKSKVFREVFAMTDLHHPNIVRYSTCWVEIEASKDSDISSRIKKEFGSECRSSNIVEELESFEESESEASPPAKNYSNTSSMAFEWDVGNGDSEKSKSPKITDKKLKSNNKKRPNKKKTGSALILKSLSKVFIFNFKLLTF